MLTESLGEALLASLADALSELLAELLAEALFDTLFEAESASAAVVTVAPAGLATSTMGAAATPPLSVNATAVPTTLHLCFRISPPFRNFRNLRHTTLRGEARQSMRVRWYTEPPWVCWRL